MKKFLLNIGFFAITTIVAIIMLVISTAYFTNEIFNFNISTNKNILVVGNSHPECAINDSILPNFFNLAQSGSGYFYDYLKVREVTIRNPQIDTVIVGYSYGDLDKKMDSWFSGSDIIKFKSRDYFFLFNKEDYISLLKSNPIDVIVNTPQTILHNLKMKTKGYEYLGGYNGLNENKLKLAKELISQHKSETTLELSVYQQKYLLKLYEYCKTRGIKLILLNVPIHPMLEEIQEPLKQNFYRFAQEKLPDALLINHSNFKLSDSDYRDLSHLNHKGATTYSEFLKLHMFKSKLPLNLEIGGEN